MAKTEAPSGKCLSCVKAAPDIHRHSLTWIYWFWAVTIGALFFDWIAIKYEFYDPQSLAYPMAIAITIALVITTALSTSISLYRRYGHNLSWQSITYSNDENNQLHQHPVDHCERGTVGVIPHPCRYFDKYTGSYYHSSRNGNLLLIIPLNWFQSPYLRGKNAAKWKITRRGCDITIHDKRGDFLVIKVFTWAEFKPGRESLVLHDEGELQRLLSFLETCQTVREVKAVLWAQNQPEDADDVTTSQPAA